MKQAAIVTGISGQDGAVLSEQLLDRGFKVYGLVRRRSDSPGLGCSEDLKGREGFEVVEGDITDLSSLTKLCKLASADYFYNLAAMSHVGTSFGQPILTTNVDAVGVLNCLEAIRESGIHTRFYQACHDSKTLAVTPKGFKDAKDLRVGDLVFSLNEQTKCLELKPIEKIHIYQHHGKMISLQGRRISQLITGNHRVMLRHDNGEIISSRAGELKALFPYERTSPLSLPYPEVEKTEEGKQSIDLRSLVQFPELDVLNNFHKNLLFELPGEDLFYLMGLYIGDGYKASSHKSLVVPFSERGQARNESNGQFTSVGKVACAQERILPSHTVLFAIPRSDSARPRLVSVLKRCGYEFTEQEMTVAVTSLPLSKVLSLCGGSVYEKHIPEFVFGAHSSWIQHLYDGIIDSDGCRRTTSGGLERHSATTVSSELAAGLIALVFQCGRYPSYRKIEESSSIIEEDGVEREIKSTAPIYYVDGSTQEKNKLYSYMIGEEDYSGPIWCLEIKDNHNFLIARDGKVAFSGNSTSELYGGLSNDLYNEESIFHPRSPYGVAKLYGYWIVRHYREAYKMFASNGILFNHEQPGKRGPNFVTRKISLAVAAIKRGEQSKLYLGNLDARRDWGLAEDFTHGMQLILEHNKPDDFVLATGETHSVREFCEIAFDYAGLGDYRKYVDVDPRFYRPAEVHVLTGDASKARKELGWEPRSRFTDLVYKMVDYDLGQDK